MKKLILLVAVFVSFASLTSCNNDDDNNDSNGVLEGTWEYSKEGTSIGGQESLDDYQHQAGCTKDYSVFTATTITDHTFSGATCQDDVFSIPYTRTGNTITISIGGQTLSAEIKTLNSTTLKIYYTDPTTPQASAVVVYNRRN